MQTLRTEIRQVSTEPSAVVTRVVCSRCSGAGVEEVETSYDYHKRESKYGFQPCPNCNTHGVLVQADVSVRVEVTFFLGDVKLFSSCEDVGNKMTWTMDNEHRLKLPSEVFGEKS